MNLLDKRRIFRRILKPGLMILIPVFFGCDTQDDPGIQYQLDSNANVKFIEFDLPAKNIYLDSLRTDGENRILVGQYNDPITGSVTAEGYFQFFYESGPLSRAKESDDTPTTVDTLQIDSVFLVLESDEVIPQRGSSFQEFRVNELIDTLQSGAIYLSNLKQDLGEEVGIFSDQLTVVLDTIFRIKLSDQFTQSFSSRLSDIAGDANQSIFNTSFKNLALVAGNGSQSINSFNLTSDTSRLIVYSSPINPNAKDTTYLTYFRFAGKNYSYLDRDHSSSDFSGITEKEDFNISSGETVIDPISGISTAFSIKALDEFFQSNQSILINSATISMEFNSETNRDTLSNFMSYLRKPDLSIYGPALVENSFDHIVMTDNGYISLESNPSTGFFSENKEEILVRATLFHQQLYRQFLQSDSLVFRGPLSSNIKPVEDLVLVSPVDVTLQRTIFKNEGIKLKLFYTEVEQ